jgi:hypothetical protein
MILLDDTRHLADLLQASLNLDEQGSTITIALVLAYSGVTQTALAWVLIVLLFDFSTISD